MQGRSPEPFFPTGLADALVFHQPRIAELCKEVRPGALLLLGKKAASVSHASAG